MTILRIGSNQKYADGWAKAFSKSGKSATATAKKPVASKKKAAPKKKSKK